MKKTKVICTIGPSCNTEDGIKNLIATGMNVARFNGAHLDMNKDPSIIDLIRKFSNDTIPIMVDLPGPKIRIGKLEEPIEFNLNDIIKFSWNTEIPGHIFLDAGNIENNLKSGEVILLDDGNIKLVVKEVDENKIICIANSKVIVKSRKGVYLPALVRTGSYLADKEEELIKFVIENDLDFVACSYVRDENDIKEVMKIVKDYGIRVIAKIETAKALENIDSILKISDGIMIDRGDLSAETDIENIPKYQKRIIKRANFFGRPVIVATELLDSMIKKPKPTRAEVSDIANAILDGASALMLSGETAVGDYSIESLKTMVSIIENVENSFNFFTDVEKPKEKSVTDAISRSIINMSINFDIDKIVCITNKGLAPNMISRFKPKQDILAVTHSQKVAKQLNIVWGVHGVYYKNAFLEDYSPNTLRVIEELLKNKLLTQNDNIVITSANYPLKRREVNLLEVHRVSDLIWNTSSEELISSGLIEPHGGVLINRYNPEIEIPDSAFILQVDKTIAMDVEQIAIGTYSPLEGFVNEQDFYNILANMRLKNGIPWPIPITLTVNENIASQLKIGQKIALYEKDNGVFALLELEDKFIPDKKEVALKMYGTDSLEHPGVKKLFESGNVFLGGKIILKKRLQGEFKQYELTPLEVRKIFHNRGWTRIVGFHTRNVPHRAHEFIQNYGKEIGKCDGLFVHPVIGMKKQGDFTTELIINGYEYMANNVYNPGDVVFAVFSTFSRYAGPREAIFTAICRKNFGCSHFIVGRDHTGVGNFYHPTASHEIFDEFDDLGIIPIRVNEVFYCKICNEHRSKENCPHDKENHLFISGTQARKMLEEGKNPPEWFMRPEISNMIIEKLKAGKPVFVR